MKLVTADTEASELTYGQTRGIEHGWWLDPRTFGLGVDVTREVGCPLWPNRLSLVLQLGPLYWAASREWRAA